MPQPTQLTELPQLKQEDALGRLASELGEQAQNLTIPDLTARSR